MRTLCILLGTALLAGCGSDPVESRFADYLSRLARVTGVAPPAAEPAAVLRYPRGRERQREVPEVSGSILELFRLARCDVAELIAERNSILGRHADAAAQLALDGLVARRLQRCRARLGITDTDEAALRERLGRMLAAKRDALAARGWNATLGSAAMADWWSPSAAALDPEDAGMPGDALERLAQALRAARAGERERANAAFSTAYRQLERQRYGGAWLKAAQRSIDGLRRASALIAEVDGERLCPQGRPTPEARVLHAVLQQRYFARIQPLLATLDRAGEAMRAPLAAMWPGAEAATPAVRAFRARTWADTTESLPARLKAASRAHARAWRPLLAACGLGAEPAGAAPADDWRRAGEGVS